MVRIDKEIRVAEKNNVCSIFGIWRIDRVKSEDVERICGVKSFLVKHTDKSLLRWYDQEEHMEDDKLVKKIHSIKAEDTSSGSWKRWIKALR